MKPYTACLGVDPSLTGTGLCLFTFDSARLEVRKLVTIKTKASEHPYERIKRYQAIADETLKILSEFTPDECFVCVEAYSFLARGSAATSLPELGAILRNNWERSKYRWIEFTPSSVKKYGTGNGAAKKDLMLLHVHQKYGFHLVGTGLEMKDSNQADAFVIGLMGTDYIRAKQLNVPLGKEHAEIFKKMDKARFYQLEVAFLF